jgi:hypothetical protein
MSIVKAGTKVVVLDSHVGFFVPGQIVTSLGSVCEYDGGHEFTGTARDYPYDEIIQCLETEDFNVIGNLTREILEGASWRILPLDALPEDKFVADMVFKSLDTNMFPGHTVAHGYIFNDSRGVFCDGDPVRTSSIARMFSVEGTDYIETRNTIYKLLK